MGDNKNMKREDVSIFEGTVVETMPNTMFRVNLADGRRILATLAGRLRRHFIRLLPGEQVKVEMTKYDEERGRIIFRYK